MREKRPYDGHNRQPQGLPWKTLRARRRRRTMRIILRIYASNRHAA